MTASLVAGHWPIQRSSVDVQMTEQDDGWIVGENGTIWRYNGKQWTAVTSPTTHTLYSLSMVSRIWIWAVGRDA